MSEHAPAPPDVDAVVDRLVERLDLGQRVRLLTGASHWSTRDEATIGLRPLVLSDGPAGVRGTTWDGDAPSACLPSPTAIAASWDVSVAQQIGRILASEARARGVDVVLGPTVNLHRSPIAGRNFECWSEDPRLTGDLATALVRALQAQGVGAGVKHFVANDSETERFSIDVQVDERTLREVYLAPFEQIVRAAVPLMLMAAYPSVNGRTMTEHDLLVDPLRTEWGFDGVVVSDWRATRSVVASARAGLDLVMPGPDGPWGAALEQAVRDGQVPESSINEKVRNLLRLAARVGALEDGPASTLGPGLSVDVLRASLRTAAAEGTVLLHDRAEILPLDRSTLGSVAVIGELAARPRIQGGGSAEVRPADVVSVLDGVRAAVGADVDVTYAAGCHLDDDPPLLSPALADPDRAGVATVRWLDDDGRVVREERSSTGEVVRLGVDVPADASHVELATRFHPDRTGVWHLGFVGAGAIRFDVGDRVLWNGPVEPDHPGPGAEILTPPMRGFDTTMTEGEPVDLVLRQQIGSSGVAVSLRAWAPQPAPAEELEAAREAAHAADVAVVVVGTTARTESEGFDRRDLRLPANQDELVRTVAAVNPRTVVVVNAGAPVLLPWRGDVAAVLVSWFGGQEIGHAVADVLLGAAEPGGRLPMSWPADTGDVPVLDTAPREGRLHYAEGIHVGYRAWLRSPAAPAYPFGHGLGYTTWDLDSVTVAPSATGDSVDVTATVRNTGQRPGKQVLQAYLARPDSEVDRPVRWLAGFAVVRAAAGEQAAVTISLPHRAFAHWSTTDAAWRIEPGHFDVALGFSVEDLRWHGVAGAPATHRPGNSDHGHRPVA